jgi:threonine synthase
MNPMQNWEWTSPEGASFPLEVSRWQGSEGHLLTARFLGLFQNELVDARQPGFWRYHRVLPIFNLKDCVSFGEGLTPLVHEVWEKQPLQFKLEYLFPSGSYKDRGASVLVSKMKEWGIAHFVEDSSGNAGCALATYAAKAGIKATIFVSSQAQPAKIAHMQRVGAEVVLVEGNREDVAERALEASKNAFYGSHVWNTWFMHGTKTFAYEIWEQTAGQLPEHIFFPVGNGTLLLGSFLGFTELKRAGLIAKMPKLHAVQSELCPGLLGVPAGLPRTKADGIAIASPLRKAEILKAITVSEGQIFTVTEEEIEAAQHHLAQRGHWVEFTGAAGFAGFIKAGTPAQSLIPLTGHGLKGM